MATSSTTFWRNIQAAAWSELERDGAGRPVAGVANASRNVDGVTRVGATQHREGVCGIGSPPWRPGRINGRRLPGAAEGVLRQ